MAVFEDSFDAFKAAYERVVGDPTPVPEFLSNRYGFNKAQRSRCIKSCDPGTQDRLNGRNSHKASDEEIRELFLKVGEVWTSEVNECRWEAPGIFEQGLN